MQMHYDEYNDEREGPLKYTMGLTNVWYSPDTEFKSMKLHSV